MTPQDEHRDGHGMVHHGDHNDANGSTHHHHHHHHDHLNLGKLLTRSISLPIWHPTFTMGSRHGPTLRTVSKCDHYEYQHSYVSRQSHAKVHYSTPPKGHVALYVDDGHQRLVVPISYLNHPDFQVLLRRAGRVWLPSTRWPCPSLLSFRVPTHSCPHTTRPHKSPLSPLVPSSPHFLIGSSLLFKEYEFSKHSFDNSIFLFVEDNQLIN